MKRVAFVVLGLAVATPAFAESLGPDEARRFVVGKNFAFNCFEGTRGAGRILHDGSVAGSVQFQGQGPTHRVKLPANTVLVRGEAVCGQVKGMSFSPCFQVEKTGPTSFRGSVAGMNFAYCDFNRGGGRRGLTTASSRPSKPVQSASAEAPQSN